jgi:hydroxymethylpyrimidine kinase/phosphomethylpyrimidine kinase
MSSDAPDASELEYWVSLLGSGEIARLHIRAPELSLAELSKLLKQIPEVWRQKIVLHRHPELVKEFHLLGCQFSEEQVRNAEYTKWKDSGFLRGASLHTIEDVQRFADEFDLLLFGPVFQSLSKTNYGPKFSLADINALPASLRAKLVLIGGVTRNKIPSLAELSVQGVVMRTALLAQRTSERPVVLSFAGYDPSAGAGVLADVKTCEAQGTYGIAVVTAFTVQTESKFLSFHEAPHWRESLQLLLHTYQVRAVKIGLLYEPVQMLSLLEHLQEASLNPWLVWDPVLSASAGGHFHNGHELSSILSQLPRTCVLTPNAHELLQMFPGETFESAAKNISQNIALCITGRRVSEELVQDELWEEGRCVWSSPQTLLPHFSKHGSGCIFSSALASSLAKGFSRVASCAAAQRYTRNFLLSSPGLLGFHSELYQ